MSGTNHKMEVITGGPVIILVEPQLGENIGMVARAMANFGMSNLRLVNPRDGWPSEKASAAASRADHVIEAVEVFDTLEEAVSDLQFVLATTARRRDMVKPVSGPADALTTVRQRMEQGAQVGILFGRERWGLENNEVSIADAIVTFPVNPGFASLNIAQAVLLMAYEWMRQSSTENHVQFEEPEMMPARRENLTAFLKRLESALDEAHYFYPEEKRERLINNLQNIFVNASLKDAEIQTLHGVVAALERRWQKPRSDRDGSG